MIHMPMSLALVLDGRLQRNSMSTSTSKFIFLRKDSWQRLDDDDDSGRGED